MAKEYLVTNTADKTTAWVKGDTVSKVLQTCAKSDAKPVYDNSKGKEYLSCTVGAFKVDGPREAVTRRPAE